MSDHDALIAAINACPFDDAPRLVYSDFIEELGEEKRAAFIRQQIKAASKPALDQHVAHIRVRDTIGFEGLINIQPWRKSYKSSVLFFKSTGCLSRIAWHRGFPIVIGCQDSSLWHQHRIRFPVRPLFVGLEDGEWTGRTPRLDVYDTTFGRRVFFETITTALELIEFKRKEATFIMGQRSPSPS